MKPARAIAPPSASREVEGVVVTRVEVDDPSAHKAIVTLLADWLDTLPSPREARKP